LGLSQALLTLTVYLLALSVGRLKAPLLLLLTVAFTGATLCGIIHLHGYAVRLFSVLCDLCVIPWDYIKKSNIY
jgi:hypothetical protein